MTEYLDPDLIILFIGLLIWMTPFFHLMDEEPENEDWVKNRQERELYLTLAGVGV